MVKEDHLSEIQRCLQDAGQIETHVATAIQDFEKKDISDIIDGVGELFQIVVDLPTDMVDCQGTQDDIKRLEEWATEFKDPKQLAKTVAKNMLVNRKDISADIIKTKGDFKNEDYFNGGSDLADILILTLGQVPDESPESLMLTQW